MKALKFSTLFITYSFMLMMGCSSVIEPDDPFNGNRYTAESDFSFTIAAEEKSKLELSSLNGQVDIVGVEGTTDVVVSGTKVVKSDDQRDADNYLKNLRVSIAEAGNSLIVTSDQPENTHGREVRIDYTIQVPANWATQTELSNGNCQLDSLRNDVMVKVTNGNVALIDVFASAYVRVTNGQIEGRVNLPPDGSYNAQTTNGLINLTVPQTTSARFSAKVTNGTVNVTGLSLQDMSGSSKEIHGIIGDGKGAIELETTNGNINVVGVAQM